MLVFIGTQAAAIHAARLDDATGQLHPLGPVATVPRPTCVLRDPHRRVLYAASEVGNAGDCVGEVLSFGIGEQGRLHGLSRQESGGGGPTHLALGDDGAALFVANFGGGQVAVLPIDTDGTLRPVRSVQANSGSGPHRRQQGPHAHGATLAPGGRWLLVPDMGADRVFIHNYDKAAMRLAPATRASVATPPGSGPRLLLFTPDGHHAFLLTELSAELCSFRWDAESGVLSQLATVPLGPAGVQDARSAAALALTADGRFLYASNRTSNTMEVYAIEPQGGTLRHVQSVSSGGDRPWCAEIHPGGGWLAVANQASDEVQMFSLDPASGRLAAVGEPLAVPTPTGLAFVAE